MKVARVSHVTDNGTDARAPPEILREKVKRAIEDHCDLDLLWKNKSEDNIQRELWRKRILRF